jgi:hypothetical protein
VHAFSKVQRLFCERTPFALAAPASIDIGPWVTRTSPEISSVSVRKSDVTTFASQLKLVARAHQVGGAAVARAARAAAPCSCPLGYCGSKRPFTDSSRTFSL